MPWISTGSGRGALLPLFAIGCFVGFLINHTSPRSLLLALSTLSMFTASDFFPQVNQPFWSLMLEIWFSALTPVLLLAAWRFGYRRLLGAVILAALAVRLVGAQVPFATVLENPVKDSVPARIDDFVIGVVIARLYAGGRLREAPQWLWMVGAALIVASAFAWDLVMQGRLPLLARAFLNLPTSAGLACVLMSCLAERSRAAAALSWWPLRVAGAMCFSLYCWHYWVVQAVDPNSLQIRQVLMFLSITIGISLLSYRFIEFPRRPWRSLLRLEDRVTFPMAAAP